MALAVLLSIGAAGCDRPSPSCDPVIYGDLPCL
jgi:hypothetical protein